MGLAAGLLAAVGVTAVLLCLSSAALPMLGGWGCLAVVTGSMEPTVRAGDLVLVREEPVYFPGEIVVYSDDGLLIVHRLIRIEGEKAITQGDHNVAADAPVRSDALLGKVQMIIPGLGAILLFFKSPLGLCALLLLGGGILLFPVRKRI